MVYNLPTYYQKGREINQMVEELIKKVEIMKYKNKIIDIYDSLPQDKVTIVYNHWKNNSPFEATRKYNDEQYTTVLMNAVNQQKLEVIKMMHYKKQEKKFLKFQES